MLKSGKLLTLNVTPTSVYALEGSLKGSLKIDRFFEVKNVSEFFDPSPEKNIVNMSGLVSAIVEECKKQQVMSRNVVISIPFGISSNFSHTEGSLGLRELLKQDIGKSGKKKDKSQEPKATKSADKSKISVRWGSFLDGGSSYVSKEETQGDSYMLKSLVKEFYINGFTVVGVSNPVNSLIPLRLTETSNFDTQGKILIDVDYYTNVVTLCRDVPVDCSTRQTVEDSELEAQILSIARDKVKRTGKAPRVYLTGARLKDAELYGQVTDALEGAGFKTYTLFEKDSEEDEIPDVSYGINAGLLMAQQAKTAFLTPNIDLSTKLEKNSGAFGTLGVAVCGVAAIAALGVGLYRGYQLYQVKNDPSRCAMLEQQLSQSKASQVSMNNTIAILSQTDATVQNLLEFIQDNNSDTVKIVSIDTAEMLVTSEGTATGVVDSFAVSGTATGAGTGTAPAASDTTPVVTGSAGGSTQSSRQPIICRGYATLGAAAVMYYQKLFNSGLVTDPVLNGVERQTLPNGQEVYVFEIQIGGGVA